jgi:hypothetical protein
MLRDFQSESLQEQWNKFGATVMDRRAQREHALYKAKESSDRKIQSVLASQQQRTLGVEAATVSMEAQFKHELQVTDQRAAQLLEQYGIWTTKALDDPHKASKPLPCLGPRAHWLDCQMKYHPDSRPCNGYVDALEECVRQTLDESPTI